MIRIRRKVRVAPLLVVVNEKAHAKQLHIEALHSTRKHAPYQGVDSLGGMDQETAVDPAAGHKEDRPLFRLLTNWAGHSRLSTQG